MNFFGRKTAPRAEEPRVIRLGERNIHYVLKRSARRTMALHVDERGVRVHVPGRTRVEDVERFIGGYQEWLLEKLALRAQRVAEQSLRVVDGALFPLLGEACRVRLDATRRGARWVVADDGVEELHLGTSVDAAEALKRALKQRALAWFQGRVGEYCARLGRDAPPVRLSSARTRWGSCSSLSGIRLHWRLIHLREELIDYVVAHEVAHLREMNHSPRFWAVVGDLYPDWKQARGALREAAHALPLISADVGAFAPDEH